MTGQATRVSYQARNVSLFPAEGSLVVGMSRFEFSEATAVVARTALFVGN